MSLRSTNKIYEANQGNTMREIEDLNKQLELTQASNEKDRQSFDKRIDEYESIMYEWLIGDYYHPLGRSLVREGYEVDIKVSAGDQTFKLPSNGLIKVNASDVEISFKVKQPIDFKNQELDDIMNQYDRFLDSFTYDEPYDVIKTDNELRIIYKDLKIGDNFDIYIRNNMENLIPMAQSQIRVEISDEVYLAQDYSPRDVTHKTFSFPRFEYDFNHEIEWISSTEWVIYIGESQGDYYLNQLSRTAPYLKFVYEDGIKLAGVSFDNVIFHEMESTILIDELQLGASWPYHDGFRRVTALDVPIETPNGPMDTVEISFYRDDLLHSRVYYAKNLGLIHRNLAYPEYFIDYTNSLIEIQY